MKNYEIILLAQRNALKLDTTTLDSAHAYKVLKFRRAVQEAFKKLQEAEKDLIEQCKLTLDDKGMIQGEEESRKKFTEMQAELYKDEVAVETKTLPYEQWHELQKANKQLVDANVEDTLEGVLWVAPEE